MRNTFVQTLIKLAREDKRVIVITPDLGFSVLEEFEEKFPNRFFNVGIAESNAVGIAAGMALSGKVVYIYSIIPFVTMRPFEQIRMDCAYMNTNVRLVGVGAGLTYGAQGATHHSVEDVAIMRALPNMTVLTPSDPYEVEQLTLQSLTYNGPIYMRLSKRGEPIISSNKAQIELGKFNYISRHNKSNVVIFFMSNASDIGIKVKDSLKLIGIEVNLISTHSIKPFDYQELENILKQKKYIFTIEEHSKIGGLGSVVAEYIAESKYFPIFKRFGLPDEYSHYVGGQSYIRTKLGFNEDVISDEIAKIYKEEK